MTSDSSQPTKEPFDPIDFGRYVQGKRRAQGLTQQTLADRLQAAASWVSQVEAGLLVPSPERVEMLAHVLGDDLRGFLPEAQSEAIATEAAAFACLWKARADLLFRLASASSSRARRSRLDRLSRDLMAAASEHPKVRRFVQAGRLQSLAEISGHTPLVFRQAILIELAGMKLDAPYETGFDRAKRLELLDFLVEDLELPMEAYTSVVASMKRPIRVRPAWRDLPAVGGTFGLALALVAGAQRDLALLLGHDPVGWFGFDFVAGTWLVRPALGLEATANQEHSSEQDHRPRGGDGGAYVPGLTSGMAGVTATSAVGAVASGVIGSAVLGPVLGTAIGMALTSAAARQRATRASSLRESTLQEVTAAARSGNEQLALRSTAALAEAFGYRWLRVEAAKLVSFYRAFPQASAEANQDLHLPSAPLAGDYLARVGALLSSQYADETKASGTTDQDKNQRLRQLADIRDTVIAAAKAIS